MKKFQVARTMIMNANVEALDLESVRELMKESPEALPWEEASDRWIIIEQIEEKKDGKE